MYSKFLEIYNRIILEEQESQYQHAEAEAQPISVAKKRIYKHNNHEAMKSIPILDKENLDNFEMKKPEEIFGYGYGFDAYMFIYNTYPMVSFLARRYPFKLYRDSAKVIYKACKELGICDNIEQFKDLLHCNGITILKENNKEVTSLIKNKIKDLIKQGNQKAEEYNKNVAINRAKNQSENKALDSKETDLTDFDN